MRQWSGLSVLHTILLLAQSRSICSLSMFPRVCVVSCLPTLLVKEEPLHEQGIERTDDTYLIGVKL